MHDHGDACRNESERHWLARRLNGATPSPFGVRRLRAPEPGPPQAGLRGVMVNGVPCECGTLLVAIRNTGPCCLNCGRPLATQHDDRTGDVA